MVEGERYGDFELVRLIATGGMAEIYLARQDSFGGLTRSVVVKRMLPQLAVRGDFVQMFLDEARLAANLNHPNIVQVFNLGEVDGRSGADKSYFIAMEFVDGPHLGSLFAHSLRQRKPLPIELCAYIVARAADGLHYAHEQNDPATGSKLNLVHRDISPQNVLVSRQGDVKVTDFGVAKASTQQTKTRTGIIKGKVAYMSPEQCLGEIVDRRTDVFALGIVLYELLTRRRLFRDKSDLLIMQKITGDDVAAPSTVNRELDTEIDAVCLRALARPRDQRFATAGEMAEALDAWLAARGARDPRGQLQRWFEQNAIELSLGDAITAGSQPSLSAEVRTPPGEATAATPSLNSAETVARPPPKSDGPTERIRPRMRAEENLPARGAIEDEPTQRAARPASEETMRAPASTGSGSVPTPATPQPAAPAERTSIAPAASLGVTDEFAPALDDAPPRRLPLAALLGGGGAALAVVVVAIVLAVGRSGAAPDDAASASSADTPAHTEAHADKPSDAPAEVPPPDSADKPAGTPAEKPAHLVLESLPPVELLVDGKSVGKSPVTLDHAPGHVKVQALFDDQPPVAKDFDVAAGEQKKLRVLAKVSLVVKSTPSNARVKVDGTVEGVTPLDRPGRLEPGVPARVVVEAGGYAAYEQTVTPKPGVDAVITASLTPVARRSSSSSSQQSPPKPGTLKMRSNPWVNVRIVSNGQKFSTPNAVQVPSGRQVLVLQNPEQGINEQLVLYIPEEKDLRVDLTFEQKNGAWKLKQKQIR